MRIRTKTPEQIEQMRRAGRVVRDVLTRLGAMAAPGVTTEELNAEAVAMTAAAGADPLFLNVPSRSRGVPPFPGYICASINEQIVHGIPGPRAIADGDIVSIDFGVRLDGWCGDSAETFPVGNVSEQSQHLVDVTRTCLALALDLCGPGRKWSDIAGSMQQYVESEGFSVVRDFVGHGIGQEMWEPPQIPNFWSSRMGQKDFELAEGMVLAIEPMVNTGTYQWMCGPDGWTVCTADQQPSAHFEHTVAITPDGCEALTQ